MCNMKGVLVIFRFISDISRLEAKIERLESQLAAKDREIATITRTVISFRILDYCIVDYLRSLCFMLIQFNLSGGQS